MESACKHAPAARRTALAGCGILPNGQKFDGIGFAYKVSKA
jgi:hypothetical protein